ncbi:DNA-3-methyladenine glycosylase family protein [Namhaeicola litoreus]|uniref:DNA-3-methyladenine glycosylase II n=1 Tax=Namhaeicola litoreus TaxID=1052145 RepID=A0ABW3Y4S0_9FLAO
MKAYQEIIPHYQSDLILYNAILSSGLRITPSIETDIYQSLLRSIVSQQLSGKVADVIWKRFLDLFDLYPEPEKLLNNDLIELRNAGLSFNKARYLQNVAEFSLQNDLSFEKLILLSDLEIIDLLTQIKGVGKWTAQMILMFPLDRPDVFPIDDLGIQQGIKRLYQLDEEKTELKKKMIEISECWRPYRSLASKYIWKI